VRSRSSVRGGVARSRPRTVLPLPAGRFSSEAISLINGVDGETQRSYVLKAAWVLSLQRTGRQCPAEQSRLRACYGGDGARCCRSDERGAPLTGPALGQIHGRYPRAARNLTGCRLASVRPWSVWVRGVLCVCGCLSGRGGRACLPAAAASVAAACCLEAVDDGVEAGREAFVAVVGPDGFAEVDERWEAVGRQGLMERVEGVLVAGSRTRCSLIEDGLLSANPRV
jgi:hypothetical protein